MASIATLLLLVLLITFWAIGIYNKFIRLVVQTDEAWADIDVQLKRRYDLIPNLIETVKGYASHERETLTEVIEKRNMAMGANTLNEHAEAESMLSGALKSLFALSESYPDLKANENFKELQNELSDTENKIQAARRFFNVNVRDFNVAVQSVPSNIIASIFSFKTKEFFDLDENPEEREVVEVSFGNKKEATPIEENPVVGTETDVK